MKVVLAMLLYASPALAQVWTQLHPTPSTRYYATGFSTCTSTFTHEEPVGRDYSGVALGGGKIFWFGGGHQSNPGNDVELYDIATNTWTQQYPPECLPACCSPTVACDPVTQAREYNACFIDSGGFRKQLITPQGRPYVLQTYQQHVWNPDRNHFIQFTPNSIWSYDPATNSWNWLSGCGQFPGDVGDDGICGTADDCRNVNPFNQDCGTAGGIPDAGLGNAVLTYDPDLHAPLWFANGQVSSFSYTTRRWTQIGADFTPHITGGEFFTAFDPDHHYHVVFQANSTAAYGPPLYPAQMYKYRTSDHSWTAVQNIPDLTNGCEPPPGSQQGSPVAWLVSFSYDIVHHVFVFVAQRQGNDPATCGSNTVTPIETWQYNPLPEPNGVWTKLTTNTPPSVFCRWQDLWFDQGTAKFYLVGQTHIGTPLGEQGAADIQLWTFTLGGSSGATPTVIPTLTITPTITPNPPAQPVLCGVKEGYFS